MSANARVLKKRWRKNFSANVIISSANSRVFKKTLAFAERSEIINIAIIAMVRVWKTLGFADVFSPTLLYQEPMVPDNETLVNYIKMHSIWFKD